MVAVLSASFLRTYVDAARADDPCMWGEHVLDTLATSPPPSYLAISPGTSRLPCHQSGLMCQMESV